jgi:putative membrane protein
MTKFILRWAINAVGVYLAIRFVPGIHYAPGLTQQSGWLGILGIALILGLVNAFLRPLLRFLTCPLIILTLGLFTLVINTFLFWLAAQIGQYFGINLTIDSLLSAFLGGLVVSIVSVVLTLILKDELKGGARRA